MDEWSVSNIVQVEMEANEAPFSLSNMIVLGQLGRGGTSHVFRAQSTRSKRLYAMKVIDKKARTYNPQALQRELAIHRRLSHFAVVSLEGHIEDSDNHYVLTEYCEGGQMTRLIGEQLSEEVLAGVVSQVAIALTYLHSEGVAHCDLKLSNLLLQQGRIKICDFGFSQAFADNSTPERPLCGTIFYMAPEILKYKCRLFCSQGDVWALGICLLILITKKQPYTGQSFQQLRKQIIAGERQKLPLVSHELQDLMSKLLQMEPEVRITLDEVLAHPFLKKHSSHLSRPIILKNMVPRQPNINKVEEVTNLTSETQSDDPPEQIQNKIQKSSQKQWSFKRSNSNKEEDTDNTLERKMKKFQITDNEKTVRTIKKKETAIVQKEVKSEQKSLQYEIPAYNALIDARLIRPFQQFHYQTKNDGFINIASNGQLTIKVKNITFEITQDGEALRLNGKDFHLKDMQGKGANKQPLELYSYARQVVQLLKEKQYAATWRQRHCEADLLLAISLDWKKVRCIRTANGKNELLEWSKREQWCNVRIQGEKSTKKGIGQLNEGQLAAFMVMKTHLCPPQRKDQS